jgi:gamma-glutamylaminecyclotransferase
MENRWRISPNAPYQRLGMPPRAKPIRLPLRSAANHHTPLHSSLTGARRTMNQVRLFVYGTMLTGQRDHATLQSAQLVGPAQTVPRYTLVDVGVYAALIPDGRSAVFGELYLIGLTELALVDRACQVPHLFQRLTVALSDGTSAETHTMMMEQVRGKRRLAHGNWLERFAPRSIPHQKLAFAEWARQRRTKR